MIKFNTLEWKKIWIILGPKKPKKTILIFYFCLKKYFLQSNRLKKFLKNFLISIVKRTEKFDQKTGATTLSKIKTNLFGWVWEVKITTWPPKKFLLGWEIGRFLPTQVRFLEIKSNYWIRPYSGEYTSSRPIWEVKHQQAWIVLQWVTMWEVRVLESLLFFSLENALKIVIQIEFFKFLKKKLLGRE